MSNRSTWTAHAAAKLARAGHRRGGAREAIIRLLADEPCAVTPLEIEGRLREADERTVSRASIYRVLEELHEQGLVQRLEFGQGGAHYEVVDPNGDHHHHIVCDACGKLTPFDDRGLERSLASLAQRLDVAVHDHEVVLRGACERCAGSTR